MSTAAHDDARPSRWRTSPLFWLGVVLLASGLTILGWAAWEVYGTNIVAHREAARTTTQLEQQWSTSAPGAPGGAGAISTVPGTAVALMRIPAFGDDWQYPILVGTSVETLSKGIGWYTGTAKPGQIGNFAVAAHRITHGQPFSRLLELHAGDLVVVETRDKVYTYALDTAPGQLTVEDTEGWVIEPVPGKPKQKPTRAAITLTTCAELFHTSKRSVAFGHLVRTASK